MLKENFQELSNSEIKLALETIKNRYEAKKSEIVALCRELEELEKDYKRGEQELNNRKNILI